MSSIIPGFEYDIFISYRQKDNNYDGWVNEFVANLQKELEATFKENITIYFDENPNDGLLETHIVDKSLEGKLKCLVFIPIISRTYCDPKSFAWQNEFCAFNKMAKDDRFGRDIRVGNGNMASRILPIKIHDLDAEDKTLLEHELGRILRAIEFVYKEAGVNRPLKVDDKEEKNLNGIKYRNQVNKVANAVKEIISSLKNFEGYKPSSLIDIPISLKGEITIKSIAVLPFVNMSSDPEQEFFSDGLTEEIITDLSRLEKLLVISRSSIMTYKGTSKKLNQIAIDLNVRYVLEGSVRRSGNDLRITAQLIDALNDSHVWAEKYRGTLDDVFDIQEKVSRSIVEALNLKLSREEDVNLSSRPIQDAKVFEWYFRARQEMLMRTEQGLDNAIAFAQRGLDLVGDNALLFATLGSAYLYFQHFGIRSDLSYLEKVEHYASKSLAIDPNCYQAQLIYGLLKFKNGHLQEASRLFNMLHHLDPNNPDIMVWQIVTYFLSGRPDAARPVSEKLLKVDPLTILSFSMSGLIEFYSGNLKESLPYYQRWLQMDNENPFTKFNCAWNFALNKEIPECINLLDSIITETPTLVFAKFALFFKSALQGNKSKALKYATEELKQEAASIDYLPINIAWGYALIDEKDEAVIWLKKSLDFGIAPYPLLLKFEIFHKVLKDHEGFHAFMAVVKNRSDEFEV